MLNRYLTFNKPAIQFVYFCFILSLFLILSGLFAPLLNKLITGLDLTEIKNIVNVSSSLSFKLKLINSLLLVIALFVPALAFAYLAYPKPLYYLGFRGKVKPYYILWAITIMALAIPFTGLLEDVSKLIPAMGNSKAMDAEYDKMAESMLQGKQLTDLVWNTIAMCIVPALVEELFFRGCLQQILVSWMRKTPMLGVVLVAILFSAFHGQLSGFIPRLFLGLLLGFAYYYTGSIWVSMLMHFFNNFVSIFCIYLYQANLIHIDITKLPSMNLGLGLGSGIAVAVMIYLFYKDRKPFELVEMATSDGERIINN